MSWQIRRVNALPSVLLPSTIYFVQSEDEASAEQYVTGFDGLPRIVQSGSVSQGEYVYQKLLSASVSDSTEPVSTSLRISEIQPNAHYIFDGMFFLETSVTTTGPRPGIQWPDGTAQNTAWIMSPNSGVNFASRFAGPPIYSFTSSTGLPSIDEGYHGRFEGQFVTGESPSGSLVITIASETNGVEVRMMQNSWMRYRMII